MGVVAGRGLRSLEQRRDVPMEEWPYLDEAVLVRLAHVSLYPAQREKLAANDLLPYIDLMVFSPP